MVAAEVAGGGEDGLRGLRGRPGGVVEGNDVRPHTEAEALSLDATFLDTGVDASGSGGYVRAVSDEEKTIVTAALTKHTQGGDLIITTAAIPGKASPKLITNAQVAGKKHGSVIIDLSAEGGGNCEYSQPGRPFASVK